MQQPLPGSTPSPPLEIFCSRQFVEWLQLEQISLGFTTYQTSRLILAGVNPQGQLSGFERLFDRAMGLYATTERLYLSTKYQLWQLDNALAPGELYNGYDKLYVPRIGYTTGDLDIHDVAIATPPPTPSPSTGRGLSEDPPLLSEPPPLLSEPPLKKGGQGGIVFVSTLLNALEDLNSDGKLHLATGNYKSNNVSVLLNNNQPTATLTILDELPSVSLDPNQVNNTQVGNGSNDTLIGSATNDALYGAVGDDLLFGKAGNDNLFGGKGNDTAFGGSGRDWISGDKGNDLINGNSGNDVLNGNSGNDTIRGGQGSDLGHGGKNDDLMFGDLGDDSLFGDLGNDTIFGGGNDDLIYGNAGNDSIAGEDGNDTIYAGKDNDTVIGGAGNDLLSGDLGNDLLTGDSGNDTFVLAIGKGDDTISDFQDGRDLIGLAGGLTFEQLTLAQSDNNTIITVKANGELLATLNGIQVNAIGLPDFIAVI